MTNELPLVITISRQFGSGGVSLGGRLAEQMKMMFLDREIIDKVAEKMGVLKENLEGRDEKITPKEQAADNWIGANVSPLLGGALQSLWYDLPPADNQLKISFK